MRNLIVTVSSLAFMSGLAFAEERVFSSNREASYAAIDAFANREDVSITSAESGKRIDIKPENGFVTVKRFDESGQNVGQFSFPENLHKLAFDNNPYKHILIANARAEIDAAINQNTSKPSVDIAKPAGNIAKPAGGNARAEIDAAINQNTSKPSVDIAKPAGNIAKPTGGNAAVSGEKSQAQVNRELQKGQAINLAISGIPDATNINRSFSFGTGVGYLNGETALAAGIHLRGGDRVVAKAAVGSDLRFESIGVTAGVSFAF